MILELRKDKNGTGFAIFVIGKKSTIGIPLAPSLSVRIAQIAEEEGIKPNEILTAPGKFVR